MTTIAWDGATLAADTLATSDGLKRYTRKLFLYDRFMYGMCGSLSEGMEIAKWVGGGCKSETAPTMEDDSCHGIVIEKSYGRFMKLYTVGGKKPVLMEVREGFFAVGSGRDFAITAMALGKSAVEAVKLGRGGTRSDVELRKGEALAYLRKRQCANCRH